MFSSIHSVLGWRDPHKYIIVGTIMHKLNIMNLACFSLTTCVVILHKRIYVSCNGCIKVFMWNDSRGNVSVFDIRISLWQGIV